MITRFTQRRPSHYRYCWRVGSSQNARGSTAAGRAGCRSSEPSPNTAASPSCSPASCNCRIFPSGEKRRRREPQSDQPPLTTLFGSDKVRFSGTAVSPDPVVEHGVLGHAVRSAELLHPASVVAVQHLLADAGAVRAETPGVVLVVRHQLMLEE